MRGLQFALLALVLRRRLEPCVEHRCRVVVLILDATTRDSGPKLSGITLILAKRPEHRRNDGEALQLRRPRHVVQVVVKALVRLDRYQLTGPPEESMQTSFTEERIAHRRAWCGQTLDLT